MADTRIVFDTETTSLDPKSNRIVSIAASCGDREFYTLVNPGVRIPRASTKVHGITTAVAQTAPSWAVVGLRFWAWVAEVSGRGGVVFVGHNAARFDFPLLVRETARMQVKPDWLPSRVLLVDTLKLCRSVLRLLPSHRQAVVYETLFGAPPSGQHDALGDIRALARIIQHPPLARRMGESAVEVTPPEWCTRLEVVAPGVEHVKSGSEPRCGKCNAIHSKHFQHRCKTF